MAALQVKVVASVEDRLAGLEARCFHLERLVNILMAAVKPEVS